MKRLGRSYQKRVTDVNRIYDQYAPLGLPNREIWRRYVYPRFGISERTFYNMLKAPQNGTQPAMPEPPSLFDTLDDYGEGAK